MRRVIVVSILLGGGALLLSTFVPVGETEYAIVTRFGKPVEVLEEAGLAFKAPWPVEAVTRIDRRLQVFDRNRTSTTSIEYLTGDKKNVLIQCFCVWRVKDPLRFLVAVRNKERAEDRLDDLIRSEVTTTVSSYDLSAFLSVPQGEALGGAPETVSRNLMEEIMEEISRDVAAVAEPSLGIDVRAVRIKRFNFPDQNKAAVYRRMQAERERISSEIRAEGRKEGENIRADAALERDRVLADARADAERTRGKAEADATRIYASAYEQDPEFFRFWRRLQLAESIFGPDDWIYLNRRADLAKLLEFFDEPEGEKEE